MEFQWPAVPGLQLRDRLSYLTELSQLSGKPWESPTAASRHRRGSSGGSVRFGNQGTVRRRRRRLKTFSSIKSGASATWTTRIRGRLRARSRRWRDHFFQLAGGSGLIRRTISTFLVRRRCGLFCFLLFDFQFLCS